MDQVALYRRYRPMTFDEIVEQDHAVNALRQSVISKRVAHAYLFSGTRGTGKTSIAKVFSRAINCLDPQNGNPCNQCSICKGILDGSLLDVIEMDAASNNSVDNIRRICDEVLFLPAQARYKVYIVDEVHMLSTGAFNALLKTLEEPPEHAVFILATTEPHRIPATIISRCQRYDFRRIPTDGIVGRLRSISDDSGILIEDRALQLIATLSDGALRDAISLLDQVGTGTKSTITESDIHRMIGMVDRSVFFDMARFILTSDVISVLTLCNKVIMDGRDILRFTLDLSHYFRDLTVISLSADPHELVSATADDILRMKSLANLVSVSHLLTVIKRLSSLAGELKWSPDMKTSFETALIALAATSVPEPSATPPRTATSPTMTPPPLPTETAPPSLPTPKTDTNFAPPSSTATPMASSASIAKETDSKNINNPDHHDSNANAIGVLAKDSTSALSPNDDSPYGEPPISDSPYDAINDLTPPPLKIDSFADTIEQPSVSDSVNDTQGESTAPNLKRAFEPVPRAKGESTNLSKLIHKPSVRSPHIPLPPDMGDQDQTSLEFESSSDNFVVNTTAHDAPMSNLSIATSDPAELNQKWAGALSAMQTNRFGDALRFKNATIRADGSTLIIDFPANMHSYIDDLKKKGDYSAVKALILSHFSGISEISIEASRENQTHASDRPQQPQWVQQMLDFADNNGIVIEAIED